ncbi:hypothetical protein ACJ41O_014717 [Fusarium nematophilum]
MAAEMDPVAAALAAAAIDEASKVVYAGLKAWQRIDAAFKVGKNARPTAEDQHHWDIVGTVLTASLSRMKRELERLRIRQPIPQSNGKLLTALLNLTQGFGKELKDLARNLEKQRDKRWYEPAVKKKLQDDQALLAELSDKVHIFHFSAEALHLCAQARERGDRVREFIDSLNSGIPQRPGDQSSDTHESMQAWREALFDIAGEAAEKGASSFATATSSGRNGSNATSATSDFRSPPLSEPPVAPILHRAAPLDSTLRSVSVEATGSTRSPPDSLDTVRRRDQRERFEKASRRAQRMRSAGLPTVAKKAQEEAMEYAEELRSMTGGSLRDLSVGDEEWLDMWVMYVRIIMECERDQRGSIQAARRELNTLKLRLDNCSDSERRCISSGQKAEVGELCAELGSPDGAIAYLEAALSEYGAQYLANPARRRVKSEIRRVLKLLCDAYECQAKVPDLEVFKQILSESLGEDPTSRRGIVDATIAWYKDKGFEDTTGNGTLCSVNTEGNSPLHEAAKDRDMNLDVLRQLLQMCPVLEDKKKDTPLLVAVEHSNNRVLEVLLRVNDSVHVRGYRGQTPLHRCRNEDTLRLLLDWIKKPTQNEERPGDQFRLVEIDSTDDYGRTALHAACQMAKPELVYMLVSEGAKIDGFALMTVCQSKDMPKPVLEEILRILVDNSRVVRFGNSSEVAAARAGLKSRRYTHKQVERMLTCDPTDWRGTVFGE